MSDTKTGWDDLAIFIAVAEAGGLAGAARATGASAATLGRRMRALERAMAREFFIRRSHGYDLTDEGAALLAELRPVQARMARLLADRYDAALPLVKIAAGTWTMWSMATHITRLTGTPADVRLRLVAGEDVLSIPRREAAVAIRNKRPTEIGLAGRRMERVTFSAYARPDAAAAWIRVYADTPSARWVAKQTDLPVACEVSSPRLALDLAIAGIGHAVLPTFVGKAQSDLMQVGSPIEDLSHDAWLVTHQDDRRLPEVRRVLDRIAELDAG